jgi:RimJ/RimL family protein N-acetyltransferase
MGTTPAPIEIESARSRPALGDVAGVVGRVTPASRLGPDQLEHFLSANPGSVMLVARCGAETVGAATVARSSRPGHQYTMVRVVPEHRRRGAGSAMLRAARDHAGTIGLERIWGRIDATDAGSLRFAKRHGLVESGREWISVLELADASAPVPPPPGVTVVSLAERPDLIRAAYDVHSECLPDTPSPTPMLAEPFHEWVSQTLEGAGALPAAAMVALAGDTVIGQAGLRLEGDEGAAEHLLTCVRRDWRGQGVAAALKSAQIAWARQAGIERLVTSNDAPNAAMLAVNQRLGYRVVSEGVLVEGPARLG